MTTPKSNPSKHYKHFRKAIAFPFRKLELCRHCRFRAGSFSGLLPRIQVFAHMPCWPPWSFYPMKQLRLPVLKESHTNSYTGPRLFGTRSNFPPPPFLIIKLFIRCLLVGVREGVGISLSTYKWKQIGVFFTRRIVYVYELFSTWNEPYNGIKNQGLYNFFAIIGTLVKFSKHFSHSCGLVLSADILQKVQNAKVSIFHRKSAENASLQYWEKICWI
jgi:hypothetical protein